MKSGRCCLVGEGTGGVVVGEGRGREEEEKHDI